MVKKKLLIINPGFPPELLPGGVMACNLAKEFVCRGYDVTVYTSFPNRPHGKIYPGYKRRLRDISYQNDFRLVRLWTWLIGRNRKNFDRLMENVSFGLSATLHLLIDRKYDYILLDAWPALCAFIVSLAAKLIGIPCYYYIQDLLPEQAQNTGMIKKKGIVSELLLWADQKACQNSAGIFVLSDKMKNHIICTRAVNRNKILVAPIQVDINKIYPVNRLNSWRKKHNIADDAFVVIYTGTLGHVSGISILEEIVPRFSDKDNILFICIGEGPLKSRLVKLSQSCSHLKMIDYQADSDYLLALGSADIAFLPMDSNCGVGSVPSKMYTYMAAEKPVLSNAPLDSENARLISATDCGLLVKANDAGELESGIRILSNHPENLTKMGKAGRKYIMGNCTVETVVDKIERFWQSKSSL